MAFSCYTVHASSVRKEQFRRNHWFSSMDFGLDACWAFSNEIFYLLAEAWPPNSTFCSLLAFLDALVTSMYLVQDVQSQG